MLVLCYMKQGILKQARKLQATLVRKYDPLAHSLTGVKCRATSIAKKEYLTKGTVVILQLDQ